MGYFSISISSFFFFLFRKLHYKEVKFVNINSFWYKESWKSSAIFLTVCMYVYWEKTEQYTESGAKLFVWHYKQWRIKWKYATNQQKNYTKTSGFFLQNAVTATRNPSLLILIFASLSVPLSFHLEFWKTEIVSHIHCGITISMGELPPWFRYSPEGMQLPSSAQ